MRFNIEQLEDRVACCPVTLPQAPPPPPPDEPPGEIEVEVTVTPCPIVGPAAPLCDIVTVTITVSDTDDTQACYSLAVHIGDVDNVFYQCIAGDGEYTQTVIMPHNFDNGSQVAVVYLDYYSDDANAWFDCDVAGGFGFCPCQIM